MKIVFTDKFIEDALRSAELIHQDDFVDCHYQDVVTAIMAAIEQQGTLATIVVEGALENPKMPTCDTAGCMGKFAASIMGVRYCYEHLPSRDEAQRAYEQWHGGYYGFPPFGDERIYGGTANRDAFLAGIKSK